jgi:hypothetical protein
MLSDTPYNIPNFQFAIFYYNLGIPISKPFDNLIPVLYAPNTKLSDTLMHNLCVPDTKPLHNPISFVCFLNSKLCAY